MIPKVRLLVSIDTEEDNWRATRENVTVENIRQIPALHRFLMDLGLRPTYFVDYPVATSPEGAEILRAIAEDERAEIGAHLHPWNTPPLVEPLTEENTMMRNLPVALQRAKVATLKAALRKATGRVPTSFRAGRFGLGDESVRVLIHEGFNVDSSVTPFVSWRSDANGSDHRFASPRCYRVDGEDGLVRAAPRGPLREVPLSCGFTKGPFQWRLRAHTLLQAPIARRLKLGALVSTTGIVRSVIGSPETASLGDLLRLARILIAEGVGFLHLFLHSPSLVPGLSPFVSTEADRRRLLADLERFVAGVSQLAEVQPATVTETADALCP